MHQRMAILRLGTAQLSQDAGLNLIEVASYFVGGNCVQITTIVSHNYHKLPFSAYKLAIYEGGYGGISEVFQ